VLSIQLELGQDHNQPIKVFKVLLVLGVLRVYKVLPVFKEHKAQ
jgi:hypothetical protein